jgi:hypothetical protein
VAADSASVPRRDISPQRDSAAAPADSLPPPLEPEAVATDSASVLGRDVLPLQDSVAATPDSTTALDVGGLPTDPLAAQMDSSRTTPDESGPQPRPAPTSLRRPSPYEVDANHFTIVGDAVFIALGDVEIQRDSLEAFGDTLRYDQESGDLALAGNARIEEETYELTGKTVYLGETPTGAQEVRAVGDAVLLGDQVDLTAPEIRIYLVENALERLVAVRNATPASALATTGGRDRGAPAPTPATPAPATPGAEDGETPRQPRAITEEFMLTGDSIEVNSAGEVLENVVAVGSARGESLARDSLNTEDTPEVARKDWMEGQTITAFFRPLPPLVQPLPAEDSLAAADAPQEGQARVTLDRLVAGGGARSLYRMTPTDTLQESD